MVGSEALWTAPEFAGQLAEIFDQTKVGALNGMHFQSLIEHRNPFAAPAVPLDINDLVERWRSHYKSLYRLNVDFSLLEIPKKCEGFDRLLAMPRGLTLSKIAERLRTVHGLYLYNEDLDNFVKENERDPKNGSYAIWIRDRKEADKELKNLSFPMVAERKLKTLTLLERLVAGSQYLFETCTHMDEVNVTLCTGSRDADGRVPHVRWSLGCEGVSVSGSSPSDRSSNLRIREAVTL